MNDSFNIGRIFCTKCGTPNKAGYRFCVKCGTKLMTPVARPQPEKSEPVVFEPEPEISQALPKTEPVRSEPVKPEPVVFEPETVKFEQAPQAFDTFEQAAPAEEPAQVEPEPEQPTFSAFEQAATVEEPAPAAGFARHGGAAFEAEQKSEYTGFARSGFTGATTPTAAAGAFATAVDAVKNNKQIDVSDAETVMSLLEQGEASALAEGLPDWDIVPPQVVVRRKHRI